MFIFWSGVIGKTNEPPVFNPVFFLHVKNWPLGEGGGGGGGGGEGGGYWYR